jgi:hypothetical protein
LRNGNREIMMIAKIGLGLIFLEEDPKDGVMGEYLGHVGYEKFTMDKMATDNIHLSVDGHTSLWIKSFTLASPFIEKGCNA